MIDRHPEPCTQYPHQLHHSRGTIDQSPPPCPLPTPEMTERDAVDQRSTPVAVIGHLRRRFFFFLPPSANRSAIPLRMYTANKSVMCQLPLRVRVATGFDRKCAGCDRFRPDESHGSVPIDAQVTVCRRSMRELKSAAAAISTNPVNVLDPIRKRFGYGQLWPLRPACSQNWADSICWTQLPAFILAPFFQRRHRSYCAKPVPVRFSSG